VSKKFELSKIGSVFLNSDKSVESISGCSIVCGGVGDTISMYFGVKIKMIAMSKNAKREFLSIVIL
jgi:Na+-transporting NADH:ubiquinone oxidoreductase subunit NqrC